MRVMTKTRSSNLFNFRIDFIGILCYNNYSNLYNMAYLGKRHKT